MSDTKKNHLKTIMRRAWGLASQGSMTFGGSAKEYFREALLIAWKERNQLLCAGGFAAQVSRRAVQQLTLPF